MKPFIELQGFSGALVRPLIAYVQASIQSALIVKAVDTVRTPFRKAAEDASTAQDGPPGQ